MIRAPEPAPTCLEADFLPASYRDVGRRRATQWMRLAISGVFVAGMALSAGYQQLLFRSAQAELDRVGRQYEPAQKLNQELARLQAELQSARQQAELLTFLRHPWPRSRVLSAIVTPLPQGVALDELRVGRENLPRPAGAAQRPAAEQEADRLPPAVSDLTRLRAESAGLRWVATLSGQTADPAALHQYLAALGRDPLFQKAELGSIQAGGNEKSSRFVVRLSLATPPGGEAPAPASPPAAAAQHLAQGGDG